MFLMKEYTTAQPKEQIHSNLIHNEHIREEIMSLEINSQIGSITKDLNKDL